MTTIVSSPVTPGNVQSAPEAADGFSYLTGEALLVYCQTRLRGLDSQIQDRIVGQKTDLKRLHALESLHTAMATYSPPTAENINDSIKAQWAALGELPEGDPTRTLMENKLHEMEHR